MDNILKQEADIFKDLNLTSIQKLERLKIIHSVRSKIEFCSSVSFSNKLKQYDTGRIIVSDREKILNYLQSIGLTDYNSFLVSSVEEFTKAKYIEVCCAGEFEINYTKFLDFAAKEKILVFIIIDCKK